MSDRDYARKIDQIDRLLNDPDTPMEPGLIWSLLDEISLPTPVPGESVTLPG